MHDRSATADRAIRGLKRDFVGGAAAVLLAGLAIGVYAGGNGGGSSWGSVLLIATLGTALAEWLKLGLTGRHLTPGEALGDAAASGILAASASPLAILQAPAAWSDLLRLSTLVATAALVLYHAANARQLAAVGRHLRAGAGAAIVAVPYLVGSLLLLESPPLLTAPIARLPHADLIAPLALVFLFNEIVANGLSLLAKGSFLRARRAHALLLAAAIGVVAAPQIAAFGSAERVAAWPTLPRLVAMLAATVLSQAGLWAQVYLVTGLVMDAIHGRAPSGKSVATYPWQGAKKGMIYSGLFLGILYGIDLLSTTPRIVAAAVAHPLAAAGLLGALVFPLAKTIIESFDGSPAFARRLRRSYAHPLLAVRGLACGVGAAWFLTAGLIDSPLGRRAAVGAAIGIAAYTGVSMLRDAWYGLRRRGGLQTWRVYFLDAVWGGAIGAAIAFYLDAAQVTLVVDKFHRYLSVGAAPQSFGVYPLLSKWGFLPLGDYRGGVHLLWLESLAGVISWSVPAWLFALNRTFMSAYFRRETAPIVALFSRDGATALLQNMLEVVRWGLWMSPIINSFLRPVGVATWYNQDGAIHTVWAIVKQATTTPAAFQAWSLSIFVYLLAYDSVRILIWLDHMGLRVATLVNLSFLGMDRLDQRLSRWLGSAATASCIPESVKRFATWAPLLIPFYIPRGHDWDVAWGQSEALQRAAASNSLLGTLVALPLSHKALLAAAAVALCTGGLALVRLIRGRRASPDATVGTLANRSYEVTLRANGEVVSRAPARGYDLSRRSYDLLDPAGRALFVVETADDGTPLGAWPLVGNYPQDRGPARRLAGDERALVIENENHGLRARVSITLPGGDDPVELWTIHLENLGPQPRHVHVVPYLEWVLNRPDADRGHTQYNRLFAEMHYRADLHAVLAWDRHSKAAGLLAADIPPTGFLASRMDFLGRARSLWTPRVLETLAFAPARDTAAHPTFDPIGSVLLPLEVPPQGTADVRVLMGMVKDRDEAVAAVRRHVVGQVSNLPEHRQIANLPHAPIGHGEIPPGTPQPYADFSPDGRTLTVHTPFTPRPYDHTMSNALGHVTVVTNRGLHTTSSVNSQQNRLTPDWPDIVTRELPGEAFYLYDPDAGEWFAPTYHPLNDAAARHSVDFGVDGTATYRMQRDTLATELTVFVPPREPTGVYLLTVANRGNRPRRLRLASYFQMVLAHQPESAGPLAVEEYVGQVANLPENRPVASDSSVRGLLFDNPRNEFRSGPAFVAMSRPAETVTTRRGCFFGRDRGPDRPLMVEAGAPDASNCADARPVAALQATLEIPAGGEETVVIVLGQADDRAAALAVMRKYADPQAARASLHETRQWWLNRLELPHVKSDEPRLDHCLPWLKYQALAERIWARRGFYQASGAFGFRDQLQDSVNLLWMDPTIARRQILLHAGQQFLEGDVVHWFHQLQDGRTGFAARTHASDNLLWLPWAVVEYVTATGDDSLWDEQTAYLEAPQPFPPLPEGKHGMGFVPLRSPRRDSVYRHCLKAIDLVLERRLGAHGLPLMGTGDWNDGLDEIGSRGRGESVWLGFFLLDILTRLGPFIGRREGPQRQAHYRRAAARLQAALEGTWRGDRYLRAIHDDGTEIGVAGSGIWEIDALTAAWAVLAGADHQRAETMFDTALGLLERDHVILLGWPALRENSRPYLGRSSGYPEGVRENGMYCHGVQWLIGAARELARRARQRGHLEKAARYRDTAWRLWRKITPLDHATPGEIETYGGQPNKQAADVLTAFDPGRMIWHGYTGAAGWLFRQALEGVLGARLVDGRTICETDPVLCGRWSSAHIDRELRRGGPHATRSRASCYERIARNGPQQ
jgi:cyclic beta-1,2-glucan synthetase